MLHHAGTHCKTLAIVNFSKRWRAFGCGVFFRATLKGANLRRQTPVCGFLQFPMKICGFLRKAAFPKCLKVVFLERRESAKISKNPRESAFGLDLSPLVCLRKRALMFWHVLPDVCPARFSFYPHRLNT